jgi:hypothetical protein
MMLPVAFFPTGFGIVGNIFDNSVFLADQRSIREAIS